MWCAVKRLLNELECLLENATAALQMANEHLSPLLDKEYVDGLDPQESNSEVGFVLQLFLFVAKDMIHCFFTLFIFHSVPVHFHITCIGNINGYFSLLWL